MTVQQVLTTVKMLEASYLKKAIGIKKENKKGHTE